MTPTLKAMLRHCSQDEAVRWLYEGRVSQKDYEHFCFFATWAAPRFSGAEGFAQERYYRRFGFDALNRRIQRVAALYARITA